MNEEEGNPFKNLTESSPIIVIKINNRKDKEPIDFTDKDALRKRASGNWITTLKTLNETRAAILMFQGQVVASYRIGDTLHLERVQGVIGKSNRKASPRVGLDLTDVDSEFQGKRIEYKTKNPISVSTYGELKALEY